MSLCVPGLSLSIALFQLNANMIRSFPDFCWHGSNNKQHFHSLFRDKTTRFRTHLCHTRSRENVTIVKTLEPVAGDLEKGGVPYVTIIDSLLCINN